MSVQEQYNHRRSPSTTGIKGEAGNFKSKCSRFNIWTALSSLSSSSSKGSWKHPIKKNLPNIQICRLWCQTGRGSGFAKNLKSWTCNSILGTGFPRRFSREKFDIWSNLKKHVQNICIFPTVDKNIYPSASWRNTCMSIRRKRERSLLWSNFISTRHLKYKKVSHYWVCWMFLIAQIGQNDSFLFCHSLCPQWFIFTPVFVCYL